MPIATPLHRAPTLWILVLLVAVLAPACFAADPGAMAPDSKIIFLHHSTGDVVWKGGVPAWLNAYNSAHGTTYTITQQLYPLANAGYPYANYPFDYWNIWVNHAGAAPYLGESTLEMLTAQYDVIVLKHCFPVSSIEPADGNPDVASSVQTLANYQLQYLALRDKMRSFPTKRFILWTGAARLASTTSYEKALRAKEFFDWVRDDWDESGDNIYLWDFYGLETNGGTYMDPANASSSTDDHPSSAFGAEVAPLFGQRIADVIEARADSVAMSTTPRSWGSVKAIYR